MDSPSNYIVGPCMSVCLCVCVWVRVYLVGIVDFLCTFETNVGSEREEGLEWSSGHLLCVCVFITFAGECTLADRIQSRLLMHIVWIERRSTFKDQLMLLVWVVPEMD